MASGRIGDGPALEAIQSLAIDKYGVEEWNLRILA